MHDSELLYMLTVKLDIFRRVINYHFLIILIDTHPPTQKILVTLFSERDWLMAVWAAVRYVRPGRGRSLVLS